MKKILCLLLAALMVAFAFTACKDNGDNNVTTLNPEEANKNYEETKLSFFDNVANQISTENIADLTTEFAASIDDVANDLKNKVLATSTKFDSSNISGTIYYVSNNGDDNADGTSPDKAWKTIDKVNGTKLSSGDAVLFECGSLFRGSVKTKSGVTYGNYGTGNKPIIIQSKQNYAEGNLWTLEDEANNIWKLDAKLNDPGIVIFDAHTSSIDAVEELTATRVWDRCDDAGNALTDEAGYSLLLKAENNSYYWGTKTTNFKTFKAGDAGKNEYTLYLKSEKDPNTYTSIEIGEDEPIFLVGENSNVTIDGIVMKFCGGHSVKAGGEVNKGLTLRNSVIAYGGGSFINSSGKKCIRYGNGIEIYGGCDGYTVQNNWIYQMFDTGITFQYSYSKTEKPKMVNIDISNNLVENCFWSLEWWITPSSSSSNPEVANIHIYNNIIREGLNSWGTTQHLLPRKGNGLSSYFGTYNLENFVVENNIFDRAFCEDDPELGTRLMEVSFGGGNKNIEYKNNVFVQIEGKFFGILSNDTLEKTYRATKGEARKMVAGFKELENNLFLIAPEQ